MYEIPTFVPSAYVVASAYCCGSDTSAQIMSRSQQITTTAKPIFTKIEFEGERSVPLSRRIIPTMIIAIAALMRKWYWITRNHSSLLFNFGLRARRLYKSDAAQLVSRGDAKTKLTLHGGFQGRPGAAVKVRCLRGSRSPSWTSCYSFLGWFAICFPQREQDRRIGCISSLECRVSHA